MSPKTSKHVILKDAFIYSIANYISDSLGIVISILSKRFLGVVGAGYWTILSVIQSYGLYGTLGAKNAVYREIPQAVGAKQYERAKELQDAAFSYMLLSGFAGAAVIWILSMSLFKDPALRWGTRVIALLVLVTQLYNLVLTLLRARKQFEVLGRLIVFNTLFILVLALAGAYFWNVIGYAAGLALATAFSFVVGTRWGGFKFSVSFNWTEIRQLILIGFPMVLASFLLRTFLNMDSIMIGKMLGAKSLGFYTVGLMAVQQLAAFPRFFNVALFPHVQERFGETRKAANLKSMIMKPTDIFSRVMPILLGASIFAMEPLVHYALPRFEAGLDAMKILVFGYYFVILSETSSTLLFTIDKQNLLVVIYGTLVGVCAGLNYWMISWGYGIVGAALATAFSYLIFFLTVSSVAGRHLMAWEELLKFYLTVAGFYLYFLANVAWINAFVHGPNVILTALLKLLCLGGVSVPVLISVERREKLLATAWEMLKEKFSTGAVLQPEIEKAD